MPTFWVWCVQGPFEAGVDATLTGLCERGDSRERRASLSSSQTGFCWDFGAVCFEVHSFFLRRIFLGFSEIFSAESVSN